MASQANSFKSSETPPAGGLSESFTVNTGVKQGCLMAPSLFLLAIDWIMKETTKEQRNGIQRNLRQQLEDLEFADDISLLSGNNREIQEKKKQHS